jgi:uncharacterized protein YcgI (DUF1989 family)
LWRPGTDERHFNFLSTCLPRCRFSLRRRKIRARRRLTIVDDEACRHDFSLTPCSRETFSIIHGDDDPHHGCQGNLEMAPSPYGIDPDAIPIAFKVFMHVSLDSDSGEIKVLPPKKQAG